MSAKERIELAMTVLTWMPIGGIGKDGATQDDLDKANNEARYYLDDATYHHTQQAWLHLNEALKEMKK